jgi:dipeptidyl-peptidase-4
MNTALLSSAALIWAAVVVPALAQAPPVGSQPLTPERVFSEPGLVGVTARGVDISPDGRLLTYLQGETDNQNKLDLWAAPIVGGAPRLLVAGKSVEPDAAVLSEAEKGRRERQRVAALSGVIEYRWDEQGRSLLIPAAGDLYLVDEASGAVKKLATPAVGNTDARFSPTGKLISYVRDQNLFIFDPATGAERAITTGGGGPISFGVAEFVAQEEMHRFTGYWWAPADRRLAYAKVDESPVDLQPRLEIGADGASIHEQRYPKAGRPNAIVELYVTALTPGAAPVKVDLGPDKDIYLARVNWSADYMSSAKAGTRRIWTC